MTDHPPRPDPDSRARTHLANERTFLAWFRTGVGLTALGVAAAQFLTPTSVTGERLIPLFSTLVIAVGVGLVGIGAWRYEHGRAWIETAIFHPARASVVVASLAALAIGLVAIIIEWLMPQA